MLCNNGTVTHGMIFFVKLVLIQITVKFVKHRPRQYKRSKGTMIITDAGVKGMYCLLL